jgi:hypothetical protein
VVLKNCEGLLDAGAGGPPSFDFRNRFASHRGSAEAKHLRSADDHCRNGDSPDHQDDHGSASIATRGAIDFATGEITRATTNMATR